MSQKRRREPGQGGTLHGHHLDQGSRLPINVLTFTSLGGTFDVKNSCSLGMPDLSMPTTKRS